MKNAAALRILQQDTVQLSTFGRLLDGHADALVGYERSLVTIENPEFVVASKTAQHATVTFTGKQGNRVTGTVFEVTDAELAAADEYERAAAYTRVPVTLASGKQAWLYVHEATNVRHPGELPISLQK